MRYAQIDETGLCVGVSDLSGPVSAPHMVLLADGESPLGMIRDNGKWKAVPVVTSPRALTFVEFFALAYGHGLTAAKYTEARSNPNMAIFFDMLQAAQGIQKDDPFTQMGADAFVSAGILSQAQRTAIFDNWPEA